MIALDADARLTSDSLMAPTPPRITYYYFFVGQLLQTLLYSLHRTLYICLNNNIQFLDVTGLNLREQIIQRHLRLGIFDQTVLAFGNIGLGKCSCLLLRIHGNECLACLRY